MSRTFESSAFPSTMQVKLRRIRLRQAGVAIARAAAVAVSLLVAAMLAAMFADWWFTPFDTSVRGAMTAVSLLLAAAGFLATAVRPVMEALAWSRAANDADAEVPELEERWTTVSLAATSEHPPATPAAQAMLEQVTSEAVALGSLVEPARVVRVARLRQVLCLAGGCVAVLAVALACNWELNTVLLRRFWAPTAPIAATHLVSVTGDIAVPRGQQVDISARLTGLDRGSATLFVVSESESSTTVLPSDSERPEMFVHRVEVDESFRYRIRAGDGQTRWHTVTAIDSPEIAEVRLTVAAPDYVDQAPIEKSLLPGRLKAIQGSRLTLEMRSAADLERFELTLTRNDEAGESVERTLVLPPAVDGWHRFETLLEEDFVLSPKLISPYGLENRERRVCRIQVTPDKAPFARVLSPTEEMTVSPDERFDVKFEAHDDHGIAKAELVVYEQDEDGEQRVMAVQDIPLGEQQFSKHLLATTSLDLSKFDLADGKSISYAVRVTDNRMLLLDRAGAAARGSEQTRSGDSGAAPTGRSERGDAEQGDDEQGDDGQGDDEKARVANADVENAGKTGVANADVEKAEDADVAQSAVAKSDVAKAEVSQAEVSQSDVSKSGVSKSGVSKSGVAKADVAKSAVAKADVATSAENDRDPTAAATPSPRSEPLPLASAPAGGAKGDAGANPQPGRTAEESSKSSPGDVAGTPKSTDPLTANAARAQAADSPSQESSPAPLRVAGESSVDASAAPGVATSPVAASPVAADTSRPGQDANASAASDPVESPGAKPGSPGVDSAALQPGQDLATTGAAAIPPPAAENPSAAAGVVAAQTSDDAAPRTAQTPLEGKTSPTDAKFESSADGVPLSSAPSGGSGDAAPPMGGQNRRFEPQLGQNTESNRLRLRIAERVAAAARPGEGGRSEAMNTRELLARIDKELAAAEETLLGMHEQPQSGEAPENAKDIDARLQAAERMIADLRKASKDEKYAFVGLQMLDVGRAQITPARDRMFVLLQDPGADPARNILEALHHTSAARELLAALTRRFEEVARENELADDLEEVAKMYEVYVESMQAVLREARQNKNPLSRKMAVVEVDQAYLDRYAQVLEMRREIMEEFARILGDDPRLTGKFMDLIKRREGSLRRELGDLRERQEQIAYEVSGWLRVDESQRRDVLIQVTEMRLLNVNELVKEASQLESRILTQLPLNLPPDAGVSGQVVRHAKEAALLARKSSVAARQLMGDALKNDQARADLAAWAAELVYELAELDAAIDQLGFKYSGDESVADFNTRRLAESRAVAELAIAWLEIVNHVRHDHFHGLAGIDQHKLGVDTDRLRLAMGTIEGNLDGLFRPDDVPAEVTNLVRELLAVMEEVTFNQAAATFELDQQRIDQAETQQAKAVESLDRAEALFDQIRRKTVEILDEREEDDPNIADLEDPTLDEFLERLEREPDLGQLLGIPDRPRNLRVIQDWMLFQAQGGGGGGALAEAAANAKGRAQELAERRMAAERKADEPPLTEEELKAFAQAEDMQEEMEKMRRAIEDKLKDPATSEKLREELKKKAAMLTQMMEEAKSGSLNRKRWDELAKADEVKAMMEALAKGEPLPDNQWNRLLSTLDNGLWQVRGRTPPEDYRTAIEQYQEQIRRLLNAESVDAK